MIGVRVRGADIRVYRQKGTTGEDSGGFGAVHYKPDLLKLHTCVVQWQCPPSPPPPLWMTYTNLDPLYPTLFFPLRCAQRRSLVMGRPWAPGGPSPEASTTPPRCACGTASLCA